MELYYRKTGNGFPLVIIHGLYGSSDNWISIARKLEQQYTVYMPDLRNHGRSPHAETHTYNDLANDIRTFFEQHNIKQATLIGHSMGGKAAMWFAARFPEKINRLIIADIAPQSYLTAENKQAFLHHIILQKMQEIDFSMVKSRKDADHFLSEKISETRIRRFLLKNVVKHQQTGKYHWQINVSVLYRHLKEIVNGVNQDWLKEFMPITAYPVTFIRGLSSNYISATAIRSIKTIYPNAQIIDIPDAGHWLHAEKPEEFVQAVIK